MVCFRNLGLSLLAGALLALGVLGCEASHRPQAGNGETHFLFLERCASDAECGAGLQCLCGACTRACSDQASCSELSASASCEPAPAAGARCAQSRAARVCAERCTDDDECSAFGADRCGGGVCLVAVGSEPPRDAGGAVGGTMAAGSGGGGGGRDAGVSAGDAGASDTGVADAGERDAGRPDQDASAPPDAAPTIAPECELPVAPGPCFAIMPRYFHDPIAGDCKRFTYGGCMGNANRFESLAECERTCGVPASVPCSTTAEDPSLPGVRISIRSESCRATSGTAQVYYYTVEVAEPIAYTVPDSGGACGRCGGYGEDVLGLLDLSIGAGSIQYCPKCDVGCCPPTTARSVTLQPGSLAMPFDWPGGQWNGPSDTEQPPGPAFPPGSYSVTVRVAVPGVGSVSANLPIEVVAP